MHAHARASARKRLAGSQTKHYQVGCLVLVESVMVQRECVRTATLAGASMDSWFAMGTGGATMPVFTVSTPLVIVHESPHVDGGSGGGAGGGWCLPRNAGAAACNESLGLAPLAIQRPIVAWQLPLLMAPSLFHALAHFLAPLISSSARSNVVWASLANLLAYNLAPNTYGTGLDYRRSCP
jgi:hypothetical protein